MTAMIGRAYPYSGAGFAFACRADLFYYNPDRRNTCWIRSHSKHCGIKSYTKNANKPLIMMQTFAIMDSVEIKVSILGEVAFRLMLQ